jgi:methylated-DNA-[protein]-cysteine S-methyltransferase
MRRVDVDEASLRATRRIAERAASEGLLDVGYAFTDSPFGPLLVATTRRGLVRLAYPDEDPDDVLRDLADRISPRVLESRAMTDEVRRELDEYFAGRRTMFSTAVDLGLRSGFTRRVLRATARIPFGAVSTYRDVARRAGNERASRAAGNALGSNPVPVVVPCHRVLHTDGGLGGYTGGLGRKEFLLELEGVLPHPGQAPARPRRR